VGYKLKDGSVLGEDHGKLYIYMKADEGFIKKADERLKDVAKPAAPEVEKRVTEKVLKEEEEAESGLGSIFGE
jgi:DNA-binding cell septation regulator SpoVG